MDPTIWSCIPFEVLEIVFLWLPLSVVIRFSTVCQQWKTVLQNPSFLLRCKHICTNEFGFMVPFVNDEDNYFAAAYLNQNGRISHFHLRFIDSRYKVESTIGAMVVLSLPTEFSHSRNYFVMNPFTKALKNIGRVRIGDWGFFSLLENVSSNKYDWVVLKHIYDRIQSKFYVYSSLDRVWRRAGLPFGGTSPPQNGVFYRSKLFWLYLDTEYEDYPRYGYTIYWFDVIKNDWGFSFVPITDIRCMSLEVCKNQLICLINDGSTSVWSIEEIDNFQFGHPCIERRPDYFEDDWGFRWKLLEEMSIDINMKCPGYLPFRTVQGVVLMCKCSEVPFVLYDMVAGLCFPIDIDNSANQQMNGFWSPTLQDCNDLIESGNVFAIAPRMDSIDEIPPLDVDMES